MLRSGKGVSSSVVGASAWTTIGFGLGQALRLAGNIALASLLFEEAFALMAIASAVLQGLTMFSDFGLGPSVVQNRRGDDPAFLNTAWTLQVIRGVALTIIAALASWPLAAFYAQNDPAALELRWLLPLVTVGTLIAGFNSSKLLSATRHMNVKALTMVELGSQVASLTIMITVAWMTRSVVALAVGAIVSASVHCALSHLALPGQRNRFQWNRESVREIVAFGKWILLSTAITFFAMQLDKLAFGRLFPLEQVGVYAIAAALAVLPATLMGRLQILIAFPMYSKALQSHGNLTRSVEKSKIPMLSLGGYLVALTIAGSQTFVDFAYDERYTAAGLYVAILTAGAWFAVLESIYGAAFLATGRARWVALANGAKVTTFCVLLLPAAQHFGMFGAVLAVACSDVAKLLVAIGFARRIELRHQLLDFIFTIYTGLIAGSVLWLTRYSSFAAPDATFSTLVLQFALVSLAFIPALLGALKSVLTRSNAEELHSIT